MAEIIEAVNVKTAKFRYPSLNGLRAISIFFVICYHLSIQNNLFKEAFQYKLLQPIINLIRDGSLGVNIFFVISGFLITSILLNEKNNSQTISFKFFYIRRTLRIFPAYFFYLGILFVLQLTSIIHIDNESWLTSITYTKYLNIKLDWITAHAWSLSIEEQFYLCWPLLFLGGGKIIKWTAGIIVMLVPIIKLGTACHYLPLNNSLSLFMRIDAIATGCLIALNKDELLKILKPYFKSIFYMSLLGLYFLIYLPSLNEKLNLHLDLIISVFGSTIGTIGNILIGIILLYSVFGHRGSWFRVLNSKILNYIGLLSYSIYLWQQLFIRGSKFWITLFPQNIIFTFMVALFSYYCIEQPFLKLKNRF